MPGRAPRKKRFVALQDFRYSGRPYKAGDLFDPHPRGIPHHRIDWLWRRKWIEEETEENTPNPVREDPEPEAVTVDLYGKTNEDDA